MSPIREWPLRKAEKLLERLEGWVLETCDVSQDWETLNGVEILLDHLRVHFERQPDEEACVLETKEASDDELEAKHQEAVALTTISEYGREWGEDIPSWDEIGAWWRAGLLDPSEGETEGSSHVGRWRQQKAVHREQVIEDLKSFSVMTSHGAEHASQEVVRTRSKVFRLRALLAPKRATVQSTNTTATSRAMTCQWRPTTPFMRPPAPSISRTASPISATRGIAWTTPWTAKQAL